MEKQIISAAKNIIIGMAAVAALIILPFAAASGLLWFMVTMWIAYGLTTAICYTVALVLVLVAGMVAAW